MKRSGDGPARSIADVLEMTVPRRVAVLRGANAKCARASQPLVDVGLDYLRLGQPVPTLSGGEAQRLKLAGHLAEAKGQVRFPTASPRIGEAPSNKDDLLCLFLFDEPTTGLHFDDVAKLLGAFAQLLAAGHSLARDRAQPRRDPRRRLDHRPRPRGRRGRRATGRRAGTPET